MDASPQDCSRVAAGTGWFLRRDDWPYVSGRARSMRRIFGDATACRERVHREGYIPRPRRAAPNSRLLPSVFVAHSSRHRPRKHSAARLEPLPAAPPVPLYRRLPWVAVATTLLVIAAAAVAEQPIRDAANLGSVPEAHLDLSIGYLVIAPLSRV